MLSDDFKEGSRSVWKGRRINFSDPVFSIAFQRQNRKTSRIQNGDAVGSHPHARCGLLRNNRQNHAARFLQRFAVNGSQRNRRIESALENLKDRETRSVACQLRRSFRHRSGYAQGAGGLIQKQFTGIALENLRLRIAPVSGGKNLPGLQVIDRLF